MKIKELVAKLQDEDPEAKAVIFDPGGMTMEGHPVPSHYYVARIIGRVNDENHKWQVRVAIGR